MSKQIKIIRTCDGCFKCDWTDRALIVETKQFGAFQLDLCRTCDDAGLFICEKCASVHKHEEFCAALPVRALPESVRLNRQFTKLENEFQRNL